MYKMDMAISQVPPFVMMASYALPRLDLLLAQSFCYLYLRLQGSLDVQRCYQQCSFCCQYSAIEEQFTTGKVRLCGRESIYKITRSIHHICRRPTFKCKDAINVNANFFRDSQLLETQLK